ncbi:hypothetical protein F5Y04DRAFT_16828 [Hypomontagnella monticulosa]|nr:hypothetical protein F5Y04DRAFT_16828 [Hypomontagnella monticulosa]
MFLCPGQEACGDSPLDAAHSPHVSVYSNLTEIYEELKQVNEECFGYATGKQAVGEITLEEYFDRLIDHIREGGARHTWDKSKANIGHALQADLIAGAFKARMLKRHLGRISHADGEQLKALCLLFYNEADVTELQDRVERDLGVTLGSLPPWKIDILGIIAYARRHADVLEYLVTNFRASSTRADTTFDLISMAVLSSRKSQTETFQHSPDTPRNREVEWRLWTALLKAEPGAWLHYPLSRKNVRGLPEGLYYGLEWLVSYWVSDYDLRNSPAFVEYLCALNERDVVLSASTVSGLLSITTGTHVNFLRGGPFLPVSAALARTILDCFPLVELLSDDYPGGDSAMLALPITQWPIDNADRLVVMEMLLEQGLVVDGRGIDYGSMSGPQELLQATCLIKAADRGDIDMVKLLIRHGAGKDLQGPNGHTAAQRARENGHVEVATYLENL